MYTQIIHQTHKPTILFENESRRINKYPQYMVMFARFTVLQYLVSHPSVGLFDQEGKCVSGCSDGFFAQGGRCVRCIGTCPSGDTCLGWAGSDSVQNNTDPIMTAFLNQECAIVNGNIRITEETVAAYQMGLVEYVCKSSMYSYVSFM